jgi:hypothetical protein
MLQKVLECSQCMGFNYQRVSRYDSLNVVNDSTDHITAHDRVILGKKWGYSASTGRPHCLDCSSMSYAIAATQKSSPSMKPISLAIK